MTDLEKCICLTCCKTLNGNIPYICSDCSFAASDGQNWFCYRCSIMGPAGIDLLYCDVCRVELDRK